MAKNKTTQTESNVTDFINAVADEQKRNDSFRIMDLITNVTGFEAKMWGPAIVGFGTYHYKYESGREGDAPLVAFSPRKDAISLYVSLTAEKRAELLPLFGKHKSGKGCIQIKKLDDINIPVLKTMVAHSAENFRSKYNT